MYLESHAYKSIGRAEFKTSFSHKPGLLQNLFLNTFNNNKEFFLKNEKKKERELEQM